MPKLRKSIKIIVVAGLIIGTIYLLLWIPCWNDNKAKTGFQDVRTGLTQDFKEFKSGLTVIHGPDPERINTLSFDDKSPATIITDYTITITGDKIEINNSSGETSALLSVSSIKPIITDAAFFGLNTLEFTISDVQIRNPVFNYIKLDTKTIYGHGNKDSIYNLYNNDFHIMFNPAGRIRIN